MSSARSLRRAATLAFVCLAVRCGSSSAPAVAPDLRVDGDHFVLGDTPTFLIFVSYFDALRASPSAWASDLDWLSRSGIQGVRVFPNWWHYCVNAPNDPPRTVEDGVIASGGRVNQQRLEILKRFLAAAAQRHMVVDVSFAGETVSPAMTVDQHKAAIASIATQIAAYPNALIDVQNEWDKNGPAASGITAIVQAAKSGVPGGSAGDPRRLVTASHGTLDGAAVAASRGFDLVAFHDAREADWYTDSKISAELHSLRAALAPAVKPIDFQEPEPFDAGCLNASQTDADTRHAALAVQAAKRHGAAAWTFHNRAGMSLTGTTLRAALSAAERAAIDALRAQADRTAWGRLP